MSSQSGHTIIIAEAGVNHCGSLDRALKLIDAAAEAGADYVKFQTFIASELVSADTSLAEYQKHNTGSSGGQLEMLRSLELSHDDHYRLADHCKDCGIKFLSTAFDKESTAFLASLGLDYWKIPSGEILNTPYLQQIASYKGQVLMSTGMCATADIEAALQILADAGQPREKISLLHCNTMYPTPMHDVNLRAIPAMRRHFGLPTGYSDHTLGVEVPIAAVALGATIIEKHFTLDRNLPGPDHKASLIPDELKSMVKAIRNIEQALGSADKHITHSEAININAARKSIVASRDIRCGERFSAENLTTRRPGNGISPLRWNELLTLTATRDFAAGEQITL